jgi:hypothetical protein
MGRQSKRYQDVEKDIYDATDGLRSVDGLRERRKPPYSRPVIYVRSQTNPSPSVRATRWLAESQPEHSAGMHDARA